MSITVKRRPNGNLIITMGIHDHVEIRAESIEVALDSASNTYREPRNEHDMDVIEVYGKRREGDAA